MNPTQMDLFLAALAGQQGSQLDPTQSGDQSFLGDDDSALKYVGQRRKRDKRDQVIPMERDEFGQPKLLKKFDQEPLRPSPPTDYLPPEELDRKFRITPRAKTLPLRRRLPKAAPIPSYPPQSEVPPGGYRA